MDEPLAGLDQVAKEEILPYIETLHEKLSVSGSPMSATICARSPGSQTR